MNDAVRVEEVKTGSGGDTSPHRKGGHVSPSVRAPCARASVLNVKLRRYIPWLFNHPILKLPSTLSPWLS